MWFVCEWAALVTSIALLARVVGRQRRLLFVVLALLFFAAGSFWRMHVERGQYYVFVLLAFAAGAFLLVARHQAGWLPGMLLGLGVALRPTMLIVPALLFVAGRLRLGLSAALTALVCVALTLPLGGTRVWQSYLDVVDGWSRMFTDVHYQDKRFGPRNPVPATVEGVELTAALPDNSSNTTLHAVYRMAVGDVGDQGIDIHLVARVCMLGTWTIGLAWLAMRRRHLTARSAFAAAMVVGLLGEFFVPSRVGYADVLYLLPLALLMRSLFPETVPGGAAVALLLGLTAGQLGLLGSGVSTWLRWVLVIGALTAAAFRPRHRPTIGMPAKAAAPVS